MRQLDISPFQELEQWMKTVGMKYDPMRASGKDGFVEEEFAQHIAKGGVPEQFYIESVQYLYHLIAFGEDQWKIPYRLFIQRMTTPSQTLREYGCGVGSDGLWFAERGYGVSFFDYPSRCVDFLRWRLKQRESKFPVYTPEDEIPKADWVFAFDVLEHSPHPLDTLQEIESHGSFVAINLLKWLKPVDNSTPQLHYYYDAEKVAKQIHDSRRVIARHDLDYAIFVVYESPEE